MIICSPQLGLSPESNLGGEVHDREMIKALDSLGVETLIILPWGKKYPPLKHAKVYFLPTPFVYPPGLFNFFILPYLFFLYKKYKFEVLRVHSPSFVGFGALIFKFFNPKVKVVATYHHLDSKLNFYDKFILNKFDRVTTVSEATRKELGTGIVISNGVDVKFKPLPKNSKLIEKYNLRNKKVLMYLGQLIERKNIPFLFKVLKKLPENYVLMICGDGPLRKHLENISPERVIFTGIVCESEKTDYYNLCDVFVYPSLKEGFGLSVVEAIACGKPVLATNMPVFAEIIGRGTNGFLENLNYETWAKKILWIDSHPQEILPRKAKAKAEKFDWSLASKKLLNYLKNG